MGCSRGSRPRRGLASWDSTVAHRSAAWCGEATILLLATGRFGVRAVRQKNNQPLIHADHRGGVGCFLHPLDNRAFRWGRERGGALGAVLGRGDAIAGGGSAVSGS